MNLSSNNFTKSYIENGKKGLTVQRFKGLGEMNSWSNSGKLSDIVNVH